MKINLPISDNYFGKLISIISNSLELDNKDAVLRVGIFKGYTNKYSGTFIIGYACCDDNYIIEAFDNIEEAYAYYQYLTADGGSNGD